MHVHRLSQTGVLAERHAALRRGLNALLPEDIVVLEIGRAPGGFDPRRQAKGKHYRYTVHTGPVPPLFERRLRWHQRADLDVEAMNRAAGVLVGEHDFSSFRGAGCEAASPVRTVDRIGWRAEGEVLMQDVFGRAFLKQMVRIIAGTCVEIGRGRFAVGEMAQILDARDRKRAGRTAPAQGLCLVRVFYD